MNQQLKRIKNKDLSEMDQRLFGNMNKVQNITSTLDNLQKFQQFLLTQIGNFQQQAKQKNHNKQVKQVITQNCDTLRQSILKVLPDLQSSRAIFRQTILSPLSYDNNTNNKSFNKPNIKTKLSQQERLLNNNNLPFKSKQKNHRLTLQLYELRQSIRHIKISQKQFQNDIIHHNKKLIQEKLCGLLKQNTALKKTINKVKDQNMILLQQISQLRQLKTEKISKKYINQQNHQNKLSKQIEIQKQIIFTSDKKKPKNQQRLLQQHLFETNSCSNTATKYLSFVQKMRLDFTAKLQKNTINNNNLLLQSNPNQTNTNKYQQYKQLSLLNNQQSIESKLSLKSKYNSIQLSSAKQSIQAPGIPRLLRNTKNNHSREVSCITQAQASLKKKQSHSRTPLQSASLYSSSYNNMSTQFHEEKPQKQSRPSSIDRFFSTNINMNIDNSINNFSNSNKKSNHDLMRKTKSKFIQNINLLNRNQQQNKLVIYQNVVADIVKIKGLQSGINTQIKIEGNKVQKQNINKVYQSVINGQNGMDRKKTASKRKLRIFSIV